MSASSWRIFDWIAIAVVALAAVCFAAPVLAQQGCPNEDGGPTESPGFDSWLQDFYAAHAQPIPGKERRLANGTAWRVVTDASTKLALPRITWMADRHAMQQANSLLDALQACDLIAYYKAAFDFFDLAAKDAKEAKEAGAPSLKPVYSSKEFISQPEGVPALTYATPRLVSFSDVRVVIEEFKGTPTLYGETLDLKRGEVINVERCNPEDDPTSYFSLVIPFRFGDILEVCSKEASAKFVALWKSKVEAMVKTPAYKRYAENSYCEEDNFKDGPPWLRYFDLTLTESGLAVATQFIDTPYRHCLMGKNSLYPTIIPYRELEPFMKPGPLRDELLK